jgi:hypothetical protein
MPYAKAGIFIDVKTQIVLDFDFVMSHEHDVKIAERIFKRNDIKDQWDFIDGNVWFFQSLWGCEV